MKQTWMFWILGKGYYEFKLFKIYWAYRWHIAESIDLETVLSGKDTAMKQRCLVNYSERYASKYYSGNVLKKYLDDVRTRAIKRLNEFT